MQRYYEVESGEIFYGESKIDTINTTILRKNLSFLSQETFVFKDTILNNINIAKKNATRAEIESAAKKASIHDFIMSLSKGYDTKISELGESLSGGEKQRIGLARVFLHESPIILLDEPTSNSDSLNEGMILRSLNNEKSGKTIILVSHRKSTMGVADTVLEMESLTEKEK